MSSPEASTRAMGSRSDHTTRAVTASAYARSVEIVCEDGDVVLEDNFFDLNAESRRVRILRGEGRVFTVRSVYDIGREHA